jgi:hypothetical protein
MYHETVDCFLYKEKSSCTSFGHPLVDEGHHQTAIIMVAKRFQMMSSDRARNVFLCEKFARGSDTCLDHAVAFESKADHKPSREENKTNTALQGKFDALKGKRGVASLNAALKA